MKTWNNPEIWLLGANQTEQGGEGNSGDGAVYQVNVMGKTFTLIGTSGPSIGGEPGVTTVTP